MTPTFNCNDCGREREWNGELIICWCEKQRTVVARPCGICGDPITTAEICRECGDELDGDAMTPTWGDGWDG